jgi:tetratricopeptide (TPR) repeat protein
MRARILLDQNQYQRAEEHLRAAIGEHPDEAELYVMLSASLLNLSKLKDAEAAARRALELSPNSDTSWFQLALILVRRNKGREALAAALRAVELDPDDADNLWILGIVRANEGNQGAALDAAERGLALSPDDVALRSLRDRVLTNLGRPQAVEQARETLSKEPENEVAHDTLGWALLHGGRPGEAVEHFREALRLDPEFDHARDGIIEAMKARSRVYRPVLRGALFFRRYSQRTMIVVIIVFIAAMMISKRMIVWTPQLAPAIHVARGVIFTVCFVGMFAEPLFNLVLRFDPFGRHALKPWQSRMALALGIVIVPTAVSAVGAAITDSRAWNRLMVVWLLVAISIAILSDVDDEEKQRAAVWVLVGIGVSACVMLVNYFVAPLGLPWLTKAYFYACFGGAGGLWLWDAFGTKDR